MHPFIVYTVSKRLSRIINDLRYAKTFINEDKKVDAVEKLDLTISDLKEIIKEIQQTLNHEGD